MTKEQFYIGQIFENTYTPESAEWCNNNECYIEEIEPLADGTRRYQIKEVPPYVPAPPQPLTEAQFNFMFFEIKPIDGVFKGGYFRKQPKGYQSAVESINTTFNAVSVIGSLPANYLTFYSKPDFADETQCTEEWLISNQFKNEAMTIEQFNQFYVAFMTAWNTQEHV